MRLPCSPTESSHFYTTFAITFFSTDTTSCLTIGVFNLKIHIMQTVIKIVIVMTMIGGMMSFTSNENPKTNNPLLEEFTNVRGTIPFDKIKPEHFIPAYKHAIEEGKAEINAIVTNEETPNFANTIVALEEAGSLIGTISSILFNLNAAETSDEIQQICMEVSPMLTAYGNDIMLNEDLFARVEAAYKATDKSKLSPEDKTLLEKTYRSFTRKGAKLSEQDKETYRTVTGELASLQLQFGQNALKETNAFELLLEDEKDLSGLPQFAIDAAAELAKSKDKKGWMFTLQAPSYMPFLQYADNRELRKKMFMASNTKCCKGGANDNTEIISKIVTLRLRMANLLGYDTYADYVLEERMAKSCDGVYQLLDQLLTAFKPGAEEEYKEVSTFAKQAGHVGKVEPWDWAYYSEKLRKEKYEISEEEIKEYFELEQVKKGVYGLAEKLWGIRFEKNEDIPVYHEEVEAFEIFDKNGDFLAVLYTDFHPRDSKQGGAWMTNFKDEKEGQRPHVSVVTNFSRPTASTPSLLTFREVETFLHEFGHALHGVFANTKYESLSGTSVDRDFVELPSQLMENWASEKVFLDDFAKHYKTGEPIPTDLVAKIKKSGNFLAGYACCRQLSFGFLDMAWHGIKEPFDGNVIDFEQTAWKDTQVLPVVDGTCMSSSFGHIFQGGYAAGYYSYKWAEVLDADAFALFQQKGVFDQATANSFRKNILEKGGTEDQMELYKRFRGQEPTVDALLKRCGL